MTEYLNDPRPYRRALPKQDLGPPSAYVGYVDRSYGEAPSTPAGTHPTPTVARVLRTRGAGYPSPPSPEDVTDALSCVEKAQGCPEPANIWLIEATLPEIMDGWLEGAYRLDALVAALHGHPMRSQDEELVAWLNTFRLTPSAQPR